MDEVLQVLIAVGGLFIVIGFVADSVSRAAVKRKIADKALDPEQIEALLKRRADPEATLKWALLAIGLGLGFAILQFLPEGFRDEPIVVGVVLIFAGAALLVYRGSLKRQGGG